MATTKVINDLIDLNQTGNTTALKGCVGTTAQQPGKTGEPTAVEGMLRTNTSLTSGGSASTMQFYKNTGTPSTSGWVTLTNTSNSTLGDCSYPTTATALYQLESNITDTCGTATASWSGTAAYSTSIKKYGTASAGLFIGGGSGNYIDSGVDPDSSTSWSVSFWMYRTNTGNFNYAFGTLSNSNGAADGLILGFYQSGSSGKFDVVWRSGTTTTFRSQGGTTIQDTWTNIIITHDSSGSGSTAYYKNGTLVTANSGYSNPFAGTQTSASNFIFGSAGKFPSERHDGYIDQIRIFPSVLSQGDIDKLANET